jgi:hypothetical protein
VPVDVINLLVKISLYAPAYGRIELREVTDFHFFVIPSEAEESLTLFLRYRSV